MNKLRDEFIAIDKKIKSIKDDKEKESILHKEYEKLLPKLDDAHKELDRFMKKFANDAGVQGSKFKSRIKPVTSVLDKVVKRGNSISKMPDAGMILVNTKEQAEEIVRKIKRKYSSMVKSVEEKVLTGKDVLGYHGSHHVDIVLPESGVVAELQIMTKKLEKYKTPAHAIYTKYRSSGDIRKSISPEDGHMSRKFFKLGNQKRRLREWIEEILNGKPLNEWVSAGVQKGGPKNTRAWNADSRGNFTKADEMEMADQSPIYRKYTSPNGWRFVCTVHAAARAYQRRLEFEFAQWKTLHNRVAEKLDTFNRWRSENYFLFYSRSLEQGYIIEVNPKTKTSRIITVLPKGKNLTNGVTKKVLVESFGEVLLETIIMNDGLVGQTILEEYENNFTKIPLMERQSTYLTEAALGDHTFMAVKLTADNIKKAFNTSRNFVTANGEWLAIFDSMYMRVIQYPKTFGDSAKVKSWSIHQDHINDLTDEKLQQILEREPYTNPIDTMPPNPVLVKNYPKYEKTIKNNGRVSRFEILGMIVNKQIYDLTGVYGNHNNILRKLYGLDMNRKTGTFIVNDGEVEINYNGYKFLVDKSKIKLGTTKDFSDVAPEGMKIQGRVPEVGDWFGTSIHYSHLASASAYKIVGFSGNSTIALQQYSMVDVSKDSHTKIMVVDKNMKKIGSVFTVRYSNGKVKIDKNNALYFGPDYNRVSFMGSAYD